MSRLLLVDKSAYVRGVPADLAADDELCLCAITRFEILYSARSATDYAVLDEDLAAFRELRMNHETFAIAATAQRDLAAHGRHRISIPDLLIGACAQQHGADVLHVDRHFPALASVLDFAAVRA
jgi:predicted nucleic acid-binding protein